MVRRTWLVFRGVLCTPSVEGRTRWRSPARRHRISRRHPPRHRTGHSGRGTGSVPSDRRAKPDTALRSYSDVQCTGRRRHQGRSSTQTPIHRLPDKRPLSRRSQGTLTTVDSRSHSFQQLCQSSSENLLNTNSITLICSGLVRRSVSYTACSTTSCTINAQESK